MKRIVRFVILLEELVLYLFILSVIFGLVWFCIFKANDQYNQKMKQYGNGYEQIFESSYDII